MMTQNTKRTFSTVCDLTIMRSRNSTNVSNPTMMNWINLIIHLKNHMTETEAAEARETRGGPEDLGVREGPMTRAAWRAHELRAAREPLLVVRETAANEIESARAENIIEKVVARQAERRAIQEELAAREVRAEVIIQKELAREAREQHAALRAQDDLEALRVDDNLKALRAEDDLVPFAQHAVEVIDIEGAKMMAVVDITGDTDSDDGLEIIGPHARIHDNVEDEAEQGQRTTVSRSKKKNQKKKRNRALKAQNGGELPRRIKGRRRKARAPAPASVTAAVQDENEAPTCVVCLMNAITWTFVPCGHSCCCEECANILVEGHICPKWCPKCRVRFVSVIRTFTET